jgi:hypothetical protein
MADGLGPTAQHRLRSDPSRRSSARRSTRPLVALARRPSLGVPQRRTSSLRGTQSSVGGTIRASKQLDGAWERSALFDARAPSGSSPFGLTHRTDA